MLLRDGVGDRVEFNAGGKVRVNEGMETRVKGVWAIGEIRNPPFRGQLSELAMAMLQ